MKNLLIASFLLSSLSSAFAAYENIKTYADHTKELKYTQVQDKKIAYIDEGEGEVIVLMHGIPTNSWMFRKMIPKLVATGHRVIAPDLLGMGQSEKTKNKKDLLVPNQAKIMMELISSKLGITSWKHLVHDFGGPITWEMMEDSRFTPSEFVFLNTPLFKDGFKPGLNMATKAFMGIATSKPLKKLFYSSAIKSMVQNKSVATKAMKKGYVTPLANGGSFTYKCLYFSANDIQKSFARYQDNALMLRNIPVKVIWGEKDAFLDSKVQVAQIKNLLGLDDSNITVLKGTKHIITEEQPQMIVDIINK